jgi:hypothetical protein
MPFCSKELTVTTVSPNCVTPLDASMVPRDTVIVWGPAPAKSSVKLTCASFTAAALLSMTV